MASGLISGIPLGQSFSRSCQSTTPTLRDIQEKNLGGVSSGHAIPQLHPENSRSASLPSIWWTDWPWMATSILRSDINMGGIECVCQPFLRVMMIGVIKKKGEQRFCLFQGLESAYTGYSEKPVRLFWMFEKHLVPFAVRTVTNLISPAAGK